MVKIKLNMIRFLFLNVITFFTTNAFATVKLPAIFSDHMVMQQKTKVQVWGWASPGEKISVKPQWAEKTINVEADASGNWKIMMQTPSAGGPFDIKINGENSIELKDVLIGEVWVCSGQSNMVFSLKSSDNAKAAIAAADFPSIRYFSVERQYGPEPFKDAPGSVWEKTSPETAGSFSAVAYYFAIKTHHDVKVPVGIVYAAWGGTPAEAWTPPTAFKKDDSLRHYLQRWSDIQQNVGADSVKYHLAETQWEKNRNDSNKTRVKKPAEPQTLYYFHRPWREPGVLFNGMINPVIPYTIKGVLWYQGESNVGYADEYEHLFSTMIRSWRNQWSMKNGQKSFPFYFVQIAPFGYSNLDAAARVRQAQYNVMKNIDHTGMAVTIDLGDMKNIHYTHKKEVGDRLALIAEAKSYGFKDIIYEGPSCKKVVRENDKLHLNFDQRLFTIGQKKPQGFEVGYKNPESDSIIFVKAQSAIKGNEITVWNDQVKNPVMVRYAWLEIADANLVNKTGLPAYPFKRTILSNTSH